MNIYYFIVCSNEIKSNPNNGKEGNLILKIISMHCVSMPSSLFIKTIQCASGIVSRRNIKENFIFSNALRYVSSERKTLV